MLKTQLCPRPDLSEFPSTEDQGFVQIERGERTGFEQITEAIPTLDRIRTALGIQGSGATGCHVDDGGAFSYFVASASVHPDAGNTLSKDGPESNTGMQRPLSRVDCIFRIGSGDEQWKGSGYIQVTTGDGEPRVTHKFTDYDVMKASFGAAIQMATEQTDLSAYSFELEGQGKL